MSLKLIIMNKNNISIKHPQAKVIHFKIYKKSNHHTNNIIIRTNQKCINLLVAINKVINFKKIEIIYKLINSFKKKKKLC